MQYFFYVFFPHFHVPSDLVDITGMQIGKMIPDQFHGCFMTGGFARFDVYQAG